MLLPHRNKYKCPRCSKLWKQKFIDDREFRIWNKKQRSEQKRQSFLEYRREYSEAYNALHPRLKKIKVKLTDEEKKQRLKESQRKYYRLHWNIKRKSSSNWERKNKEYRNEYHKQLRKKQLQQNPNYYKEQYWQNREIKLTQQKTYYQLNREKILRRAKEKHRQKKAIALIGLKNKGSGAQEAQIIKSLPTAHFRKYLEKVLYKQNYTYLIYGSRWIFKKN